MGTEKMPAQPQTPENVDRGKRGKELRTKDKKKEEQGGYVKKGWVRVLRGREANERNVIQKEKP